MQSTQPGRSIERLAQDVKAAVAAKYPSLDQETRSHVETACAAFHLARKPQTLRAWACLENGPIRPVRVNGRLAWRVADLKALLTGETPAAGQ